MHRLILTLFLASIAFGQSSPPSPQSRVAGRFVAYNYGQYQLQTANVSGTTPGTATVSIQDETVKLPDGRLIMPISTTTPIKVGSETVTPSTVIGCYLNNHQRGTCQFIATFAQAHNPGEVVTSATFGLQEALNDAGSAGGGPVSIDAAWSKAGGTSVMVTAATIPSNTSIEDIRTTAPAVLPGVTADGANGIKVQANINAATVISSINSQVNPMASPYNARGNGTTDDTAAIQAAWTSLGAASGSVLIPNGTFLVSSGTIYVGATGAGSQRNFRMLTGNGHGSTINCAPSAPIDSCINVTNSSRSTIKNLTVTCNANVMYCVKVTTTGGSNTTEGVELDDVYISGGQYGWAIGPDSHADVSHVTGHHVFISGAALADVVSGDGTQGNVLDNNCYGCTFDTSGGNGILIQGGGFSMFGGGFDSNADADVHQTTPSSQPLKIVGVRSENSPRFLYESNGSTAAIPGISLDSDLWFSSASPATYAVQVTSAIPISITDSRFASTSGTVSFYAQQSASHPTVISMRNVGTSNASFPSVLAAMAANPATVLNSQGDYYFNPSTYQMLPGSGIVYSSGSGVWNGNVKIDQAGNISTSGNIYTPAFFNVAGGIGAGQNMLMDSANQLGTTYWSVSLCNTPNPPTLTANTTDVPDPNGGNTALKVVTQAVTGTGCGTTVNTYQQSVTLTSGHSYTINAYLRGAAGGELGNIRIGNSANIWSLTTAWALYSETATAASTGSASVGLFLNSTSATLYIGPMQLCDNTAGGCIYIKTVNAPATVANGVFAFGTPLGTSNPPSRIAACSPTAPIGNTGNTTLNPVFSCSIPAYTLAATGHLRLTAHFSACTGSAAPYSGCTAANTGTCTPKIALTTSPNVYTGLGLVTPQPIVATKIATVEVDLQQQNSTSSQLVDSDIRYVNSGSFQGAVTAPSLGTQDMTALQYVNLFLQNSVSGDTCFLDQVLVTVWP